jgi:octaprenyl-diphosphate synthase
MAEMHAHPRSADSAPAGPGSSPSGVLPPLQALAEGRGLAALAQRLGDLAELTQGDVAVTEASLSALERGPSYVARSAHHLLDLGGKRLRPLCVALAARAGSGFSASAQELAVAVELVHGATLLHDDVVDLGEARRGAPAARMLYGNAASIFAGDWLLVEALRRVRRAAVPGLLGRLLDVIEEMIFAESEQLEARGRIAPDRAAYLRIVEGKTAALFRWALFAGARAGALPTPACRALEEFGRHLGIAFQIVDDVLDLRGDQAVVGKSLLGDLREGKMTFPLIVAVERRPELVPLVARAAVDVDAAEPVVSALVETGAIDASLALARHHVDVGRRLLEELPPSRARTALETVAEAAVARDR